jgi:hypothetical protein
MPRMIMMFEESNELHRVVRYRRQDGKGYLLALEKRVGFDSMGVESWNAAERDIATTIELSGNSRQGTVSRLLRMISAMVPIDLNCENSRDDAL